MSDRFLAQPWVRISTLVVGIALCALCSGSSSSIGRIDVWPAETGIDSPVVAFPIHSSFKASTGRLAAAAAADPRTTDPALPVLTVMSPPWSGVTVSIAGVAGTAEAVVKAELEARLRPEVETRLRAELESKVRAEFEARGTARLEAYKQGTAFHVFQEGLFWTRNNILVLVQGVLLAAVGTMLQKGTQQPNPGIAVLSFVGLTASVAWVAMVIRSRLVLSESLNALSAAETSLLLDGAATVFGRVNKGYETVWDDQTWSWRTPFRAISGTFRTGTGVRLSTIWQYLGSTIALVWAVILALSFRELLAHFRG